MAKITETGFYANDNFFELAGRAFGFKDIDVFKEIFDNETDAHASKISITYKPQKNKKLKDFTVHGDGIGFKIDHDSDIQKKFNSAIRGWGRSREYGVTDTGQFGIGMSAGFNEFMRRGACILIETSDGKKSISATFKLNEKTNLPDLTYEMYSNNGSTSFPLNISGTNMRIVNIPTSLTEDKLLKDIKVVYYPWKNNNKNAKMYFNKKEVQFTDPLYRHIKDGKGIWNSDPATFKFTNEDNDTFDIDISARGFFKEFVDENKTELNKSTFENSKGDWLPIKNSGLYVQYGNRFISIGGQSIPGIKHGGHDFTGLRIFVHLAKRHKFPIFANKSMFEIDENDPSLSDFLNVIKDLTNVYRQKYGKHRGGSTLIRTELKQKINDAISKVTDDKNLQPIAKVFGGMKVVEKREYKGRDKHGKGIEPKGTNKTRSGNTVVPSTVFEFAKDGEYAPYYSWSRINGTIIITLNEDSYLVRTNLKAGDESFVMFCIGIYFELYSALQVASQTSNSDELMKTFNDIIKVTTEKTNDKLS